MINIINGAHHEHKLITYWLQNIFPELNLPNKEPWYFENTKIELGISANLDLKLNGVKKGNDIIYSLSEDIKIPYIFWTGENFDVKVNSLTGNHKYIIISSLSKSKDNNVIPIPFASFWYIQFYLIDYLDKYRNKINIKTNFLAYCATRDTIYRNKFMKLLIRKYDNPKKIFCLGNITYNECTHKKINRTSPPNRLLVDEYSKFKFVLTMENTIRDGYITEKIICVFLAGSIPIYWGDHNYAKKLFNPKSFICIQDFENFEKCINYVLEMSDEDIENMSNEPMFRDNIIPAEFDITNFSNGLYGDLKKKVREICSFT